MRLIACCTLFRYVLWGALVLSSAQNTVHYSRNTVWNIPRTFNVQNRIRLASMINWLEGPFVNDIAVGVPTVDEIHLYDSYDDPSEHVLIPENIAFNPINLRSFLNGRRELSVKFTANVNSTEPVELRWVHFRGNLRLEPLSGNGSPLVIQPGDSVRQYTGAGHLFVAMCLESTQEGTRLDPLRVHEQHEGFAHLDSQIHRIVGMYMMPAIHQQCAYELDCSLEVTIDSERNALYHIDKLAAGTACDATAPAGDLSNSVDSNATECFRALLMKYWEHQRLSQVYVNTWAVPTIPKAHLPNELTFEERVVLANEANEENIDMDGEVSPENEQDLWTVFDLNQSLTESLLLFHRNHRRVVGFSSPEPPISLVFNQFEVPTRYVPLPPHLLDSIIEAVRSAAATWLGMRPEDLLLTGAYGSREYGRGAVVRWHVDPVHSQPITAIVHLAEQCDPRPIPGNFEGYSADPRPIPGNFDEVSVTPCGDLWAIQLPKDLSAEHNYTDYSSDAVHSPAWHHVYLRVGQVMLLQSAKLPHARMVPYPGNWYANAFVHFAPVGWENLEAVRLLS